METQAFALDTSKLAQGQGSKWYLAKTEALADVTDARKNEKIGIVDIQVTPMNTDKARQEGALASIYLRTVVGNFNFSVFRGKKDPSALRLAIPSRKYIDADGTEKYVEHYALSQQVRAQVLRHVHSFAQQQAQAQTQAQVSPQMQALAGIDPAVLSQLLALVQSGALGGAVTPAPAQQEASVPGILDDVIDDSAF